MVDGCCVYLLIWALWIYADFYYWVFDDEVEEISVLGAVVCVNVDGEDRVTHP